MSKKLTKEKPNEILELEKLFNIKLNEEHDLDVDIHLRPNMFTINLDGEINRLCITNAGISEIDIIEELKDLEYLDLSNNEIISLEKIISLSKLKYLYVGGNKISDISLLPKFKYLIELALWENPIDDFTPLKKLKQQLEGLFCQRSGIEDLNFLSEQKNLKRLFLGENEIENIQLLSSLTKIKDLRLEGNKINSLPDFNNSNELYILDFSENKVKFIPSKIAFRFDWLNNSLNKKNYLGLSLIGNPLSFPPTSIIELGPETTQNYYETSEEFGHQPISEGRIIFVGDSSSGKSSLIEKLLYNTFQQGRPQTNGILIEHLHLFHPEDGRDLTFHIWDFGGQEIQHAVHKFFFTESCLYVLVLDNRKEEEPDYWLQQIESLGGSAPVLVVFNKQDENAAETVDRKFLKEKYPNIVGFYKTSCKTDFGIVELKSSLEREVVKLRTVDEQFPNNWLQIKKEIEERTSGSQHYLTYEVYKEICKKHHTIQEEAQKLLLRYFNTIGAITWFGEDTNLQFLHVLSPTWITQGVYKIITAKKTAHLFGQIRVSDFKELLQPIESNDYTYEESHYGYILSMMTKFELCYSPDGKNLFIPSAFGKEPKVEYSSFRGEDVRTYILQFTDYMPLALIHRFTTQRLGEALDKNYWYTGIVIKDPVSDSLAMVHADKEAKRIYVRIKGNNQLGVWEDIRRGLHRITSNYAKIPYDELVALDSGLEYFVNYNDLLGYLKAKKGVYFHPGNRKDYNVGYLIGLFESKEETLERFEKGELSSRGIEHENKEKLLPIILNIINNNSPTVNTKIVNQITIDIDVTIVNELGSDVRGEADYLLEQIGESNKELKEALQKVIEFAEDAKSAQNSGDVKSKGWKRKLKSVVETIGNSGKDFKNIKDGNEALVSMFDGLQKLAKQFHLDEISNWLINYQDRIPPQTLV